MVNSIAPLFEDDNQANETLVTKIAFFGDFCVASHMRAMWESFSPYADADFVRKIRQGVQGLQDHHTPGQERTNAHRLFHRCYWEMYVGCALLEQGIMLVPRDQWDKKWDGAGPDLMADVDGRRVWVECVAPGPGDGADAVQELINGVDEDEPTWARSVPVPQIKLRLLNAIKEKSTKHTEYRKKEIVKHEDGYVIAINSHLIQFRFPKGHPPHIVNALYGLGPPAVTYNLTTREWSEPSLTLHPSIRKQNNTEIDANLFGNGEAVEISGVIYSAVNAWNPKSPLSSSILYVHNHTAYVPLPNRWLPMTVSYSVSVVGSKGTVTRTDPEPERVTS